VSDTPSWDELRESGVEFGVIGDSGTNDFALFRESFKERLYTSLDLSLEERALADEMIRQGEIENDLLRLRREQFLEHAHSVAEQVSAELSEYVHAVCGGEIEYITDETNSARTNFFCAKCDEYLGFFIDGGTVDLDEIRASVSGHPDTEFTVWGEEL
jgi:hypothetical protein